MPRSMTRAYSAPSPSSVVVVRAQHHAASKQVASLSVSASAECESEFGVRVRSASGSASRERSDSGKKTLGLRVENPRTPSRKPSDSESTTPGLRVDNPRTPSRWGSDSDEKRSECELGVRRKNLGLRARTPSASVAAVASVAPAPLPSSTGFTYSEYCTSRVYKLCSPQ